MKHLSILNLLLVAAPLLAVKPAAAQGSYSELRLIYVDNSREESGSGYSSASKAYVRNTVQQLVADNSTNMLFFYSNGEQPQYTRTQEKVMGMLGKLDDKPAPRPEVVGEKRQLRAALYKGRLDLITSITIDLFVTERTLRSELSGERSGYLLNLFPRELQFMSKCNPGNITVRVHYPGGHPDLRQQLESQTAFCQNCAGVTGGMRYEFREMQ